VYRSFLLALMVCGIVIGSLLLYSTPVPKPSIRDQHINSVTTYLETLHHQQPTHRDVLLNLSRVARFLGNNEQADSYDQAATDLDPNFTLR
jgi:hypothetical protein